jgi:hypothetical protein
MAQPEADLRICNYQEIALLSLNLTATLIGSSYLSYQYMHIFKA